MTEFSNLNKVSQSPTTPTDSNGQAGNESDSSRSSTDFFGLSKTCGDSCSVILLVIMILATIGFTGLLIYCKYYRKPAKKIQNIVVQVKAIQINPSVLEHIRSLSENQMSIALKNRESRRLIRQIESPQGDARTSVQMEMEYKNYLHNQALNNVINGQQMLDYDSSVQYVKDSQMNNYKDIEQLNFQQQLDQNNKKRSKKQKEITISQQGERKDLNNCNVLQILPKRFVKSEQGHYSNDVTIEHERNNSSLSNQQKNIKKSGLVLNESSNSSSQFIRSSIKRDADDDSQIIKVTQNQSSLTDIKNNKQYETQTKPGKIKLVSLYPIGNKVQMETVLEDQQELAGNTKTLELNKHYRRKLNIQKQMQSDPSFLLDSSLNNSAIQNPESSMLFNNSILNSNQQSCKNQNSKLLGEYFQDEEEDYYQPNDNNNNNNNNNNQHFQLSDNSKHSNIKNTKI